MNVKRTSSPSLPRYMNVYPEKTIIIGITGCLWSTAKKEVVGVKGVGKDTVTNIFRQLSEIEFEFHQIAFADALKNIVCNFIGIDRNEYDNAKRKEDFLKENPSWTLRKLLEIIGTDIIRNNSHDMNMIICPADIWVEKVRKKIKMITLSPIQHMVAEIYDLSYDDIFENDGSDIIQKTGVSFVVMCNILEELLKKYQITTNKSNKPKLIIISDMRFENEYRMIKKLGGYIIRVNRKTESKEIYNNNHITNRSLNVECDFEINNFSDISYLISRTVEIWRTIQKKSVK